MKPSDFHEIWYGYLKQLSRKRLFLEQRLSNSYAFIDDVKEFLPALSKFLARFG